MGHRIVIDLPDDVYQRAEETARANGIPVEDALQRSLRLFWTSQKPGDSGLEGIAERLACVGPSIEGTDWLDTPEDREWDRWQPSQSAI